jgi:hypothetical protein
MSLGSETCGNTEPLEALAATKSSTPDSSQRTKMSASRVPFSRFADDSDTIALQLAGIGNVLCEGISHKLCHIGVNHDLFLLRLWQRQPF